MDTNKLENILNCNEELRKKIGIFMEMFIEYYGESERDYITERFSNALFSSSSHNLSLSFFSNSFRVIENDVSVV